MRARAIRSLAACYLALLAALLLAAGANPVALQKANAVREVGTSIPPLQGEASLDVERVLSAIPFDPEDLGFMVWEVDPDRKYQRTILEGRGNCSNFVFGLARLLELSDVDFQIVHMMRPRDFLEGRGHTVIRTRYLHAGEERVGLVDVFAGGLPQSAGRLLDASDLRGPVPDFSFLSWNGRPELAKDFFRELPPDVVIGWISRADVERYFRFLERFYVPLGSSRIEKYLYDGVALLLGFYPPIQVEDIGRLRDANPLEWHLYQFALWSFRSALVGLPLLGWLAWRRRP